MGKRLSVWYLFPPLLTAFLIWPIIADFPPMKIPSNFNWLQILIVSPFYVGILAAPGYIYAWLGHYDTSGMRQRKRTWIKWSLWSALFASIGGLTTVMAIVPLPSVMGSIASSILLLEKYYKSLKAKDNDAN